MNGEFQAWGRAGHTARTLMVVAGAGIAALSLSSVVLAADLNSYDDYKPRAGSPYDDPRYAELYGPDKHQPKPPYRRRPSYKDSDDTVYLDQYGNRVERPAPRYPVDPQHYRERHRYEGEHKYARRYRDRDAIPPRWFRDERRYPPYGARHPRRFRLSEHCVPRRIVMRRLTRQGWYSFSNIRFRGPKVIVVADNEDGGRYRLVIDRCSGEIVRATRKAYRYTDWRRRRYRR